MLPTDQPSNIHLNTSTGNLIFTEKKVTPHNAVHQSQFLYVISDDEIKDNNWFYNASQEKIFQHKGDEFNPFEKVIASTDTSLKIFGELNKYDQYDQYLPSLTNEFLQKYCALKGIEEVEIEYLNALVGWSDEEDEDGRYQNPVYNDFLLITDTNTINIKL